MFLYVYVCMCSRLWRSEDNLGCSSGRNLHYLCFGRKMMQRSPGSRPGIGLAGVFRQKEKSTSAGHTCVPMVTSAQAKYPESTIGRMWGLVHWDFLMPTYPAGCTSNCSSLSCKSSDLAAASHQSLRRKHTGNHRFTFLYLWSDKYWIYSWVQLIFEASETTGSWQFVDERQTNLWGWGDGSINKVPSTQVCTSPEYACEKPSLDVYAWNPSAGEAEMGRAQKKWENLF